MHIWILGSNKESRILFLSGHSVIPVILKSIARISLIDTSRRALAPGFGDLQIQPAQFPIAVILKSIARISLIDTSRRALAPGFGDLQIQPAQCPRPAKPVR